MANIDKTDFIWNGKLTGAVNLVYSDLLNVDVVRPTYSWTHRNSSFFLETRLGYLNEEKISWFLKTVAPYSEHKNDWEITDVKAIWDTNCSWEEWNIFMIVHNLDDDFRWVISARVENWCVTNQIANYTTWWWNTCWCWDWKFFKTIWPKGTAKEITEWYYSVEWIQVNVLEGWVYRWYFTTQWILDWTDTWWNIAVWDYLVITMSTNEEWSWFAWQTRMVTGFSDDMKYLMLDTPWNWFAVADEYWNTYKRVEGKGVTAEAYDEEWDVIWLSRWEYIDIFNWSRVTYQPTWGCIISMTESNGRVFALYNNGFVRYSKVWWRDQFFFDDEMYAWADKSSLYAYRDFVIAFGERSISVGSPIEFNNQMYYTMYQQSWTMGLKSRYSYWEHDWNLIFVSNDNRLMALWVAATSWKYMLSFQDIGKEIINSKLSTMLPSDEAFIADYDNQLRVIVNTREHPIKTESNNNQTHIYKFDNLFNIWTEDHLANILLYWYNSWVWYWQKGLYVRWLVNVNSQWNSYSLSDNGREWIAMDFNVPPNLWTPSFDKPIPVTAKVWAFLIENEQNWLSTQSNVAPGLFNLAKLNRLIVTLWYWRYSEQTKIKITSYREGIGAVEEIKTLETNDWINLISLAYDGISLDDPEYAEFKAKKQCLIDSLWEWQKMYESENPSQELKINDLTPTTPWCEGRQRMDLQDHNICIDSSLYELAPHKPLVFEVWENQNYSSQIKVEVISQSWDVMNFGWFLAELFVAPLGVKWADWENLVELSSC